MELGRGLGIVLHLRPRCMKECQQNSKNKARKGGYDHDKGPLWERFPVGWNGGIYDLNECALLRFIQLRHFKLSCKDVEGRLVILHIAQSADILHAYLRTQPLGNKKLVAWAI